MILLHNNLKIELSDSWWAEAGMHNFHPVGTSYRVDLSAAEGKTIFEVRISEVRPVVRAPGVGIFNDNEDASAKERVVSILKGFVSDAAIPPVRVVNEAANSTFRFKLVEGAHRFYCSLAAGFSHVPAVEGFDWSTLDQ